MVECTLHAFEISNACGRCAVCCVWVAPFFVLLPFATAASASFSHSYMKYFFIFPFFFYWPTTCPFGRNAGRSIDICATLHLQRPTLVSNRNVHYYLEIPISISISVISEMWNCNSMASSGRAVCALCSLQWEKEREGEHLILCQATHYCYYIVVIILSCYTLIYRGQPSAAQLHRHTHTRRNGKLDQWVFRSFDCIATESYNSLCDDDTKVEQYNVDTLSLDGAKWWNAIIICGLLLGFVRAKQTMRENGQWLQSCEVDWSGGGGAQMIDHWHIQICNREIHFEPPN